MLLPARETPLMCAFNMVLRVMHDAVRWSIMRSDRRQTPSLSPGLRAQTIVAWQRMSAMIDEFNRLLHLAQRGRLRGHVRAAEGDAAAAGESDVKAGDANAHDAHSGDAKSGDAKPGGETGAERKARVMRVLTHPFGAYAVTGPGQLPPLTYQQMHGFGWMRSFAGADAARARLVELLDDPVTVEVIRGSKSMTRIVRRLCHGLEVTAPAGVLAVLPRRKSCKKPKSEHKVRRPYIVPDHQPMSRYMLKTLGIVVPNGWRDREWAEKRRVAAAEAAAESAAREVPPGGRSARS